MVAPRTTERLLWDYVLEGRGIGHGEGYQAWIQLKRWNASPVSVQTSASLPPFARRGSFLSRSEWLLGLAFSWVGCHVREQYPLWPWPHMHPLYERVASLNRLLPRSSGTLEICKRAGIEHGMFVGTSYPYIWTMDLCATLAWLPDEHQQCALVSVKPLSSEQYTGDIDPVARGPEKLEVERLYALELGIPYFVADRSIYPGPLLGQLEWLSVASVLRPSHPASKALNPFLQKFGPELQALSPNEWKRLLQLDFGLVTEAADTVVQHILWHQFVDVDLSKNVNLDAVPKRGGRGLRNAIRENLRGAK
ncbi:hypothetical protein D3C78_28250 [compost metagenome]